MNAPYRIEMMFEVYETTDDRGKRGRLVGLFQSNAEAKVMAEKKGWFGGGGEIVAVNALVFDEDTVFVLRHKDPIPLGVDLIALNNALRESALARLRETVAQMSPAERAQINFNEANL